MLRTEKYKRYINILLLYLLFFVAISLSYFPDLSHKFLKRIKVYEAKLHVKSTSFSTDNSRTSSLSIVYHISNHKNFIPKYLDNALTDFP